MKRKIHPHLKHFIHQIVVSELATSGEIKENIWKEHLLKEIQVRILSDLNEKDITTQDQLNEHVKNKMKVFQGELNVLLGLSEKIFGNVSIELLNKYKR
jgi:hypothetical protein